MDDKYTCFAALAARETAGRDYRIRIIERRGAPVLVVAPHGGTIEVGTSELAGLVAGAEHSLFVFEGLKPRGPSRDLHITSHRFDHPQCLSLASRCPITLALHGCRGESHLYLGGLDRRLKSVLEKHLGAAGLPVSAEGHRYLGRHPLNICNRGTRGRGAQIEITHDLRTGSRLHLIAGAVRSGLHEYVAQLNLLR